MRLKWILVFYLFVFTLPTWACQFVQTSPAIRTLSYEGAKIDMLFSSHTTGTAMNDINSIINSNPSPQAQAQKIREYLSTHNQLQQDQRKNYGEIKRAIEGGNLSWLGVEFSPSELQRLNFYDNSLYLSTERRLKESFGSVLSTEELEKLLFLTLPAEYIYFSRNQDKTKGIKVVSLESDASKNRAITMAERSDLALQRSLAVYGNASADDQRRFQELIGFMYPETARATTDMFDTEHANSIVDSIEAENLRARAKDFLNSEIEFENRQRERDQVAANLIVQQQGDGFVIFGSNHGKAIEDHITRTCQGGATPRPNRRTGVGSDVVE